jgi:hypothetical protein
MGDTHEVISAFLDDEPFDANALAAALSEPAGRELLIDLMALRHLVRADGTEAAVLADRKTRHYGLRALIASAAVFVALVGGYLAGQRRGDVATSEAPPATRVVQSPGAWKVITFGSLP